MLIKVLFCDHMTQLSRVSGICKKLKPLYCRDEATVDVTDFLIVFNI